MTKLRVKAGRALRTTGRAIKGLGQMVFSRPGAFVGRWLLPRTGFDYAAEVGDGLTSSVLMAPVLWMARTFPEAPIRVLDEDGAPVEPHDMIKLLRRPTPHYSGKTLWKATIVSWALDGNAYWLKVRNKAGSSVLQLWYVPHWMIKPVAPDTAITARPAESKLGDDYVSHYEYSPDGQTYPVAIEDVVHFRDGLDPRDVRKGLSPLGSLFREIFTDDEAANFAAALLKNLGVPGLVLSPEGEHAPSPDDVKATKEYADEEFVGDRRGKPLVMSGPTKVQQFGFNPEQMRLRELRRIPEERASAIHGVPAIVCGLGAGLDRSTFANFAEAREAGYEQNIIPTQGLMGEELYHQLLPDFGEGFERQQVAFDLSKVRVLQEDRNKEAERVATLYDSGLITRGDGKRELGLETSDADEVYKVPINVSLLGAEERLVLGAGGGTEPPPTDTSGGGKRHAASFLSKQAAQTGAMVALYPDPATAEALAVPDGEPVADLHLTLAFLGDAAAIDDPERLADVVRGFAATAPALRGEVSGIGHFTGGPEPVTYASADVPGLPDVRERLVDVLRRAGYPPSAEHGFTPHITLAFAELDAVLLDNLPLEFDSLSLVVAEERSDFPLTGTAPKRRRGGKSRAAARADYERGLVVIEALRRDEQALAAAFARELDKDFTELGNRAADAYTDRAEPGLAGRRNGDVKASDSDAAAGTAATVAEWAEITLLERFETHTKRVADTTVQTINSILDLGVMIPDPVARRLIRDGGRRLGMLDIPETTKRAILRAISEGRAEGKNPIEIARRIRELVPAGRFTNAGSAYRAKLIARTETLHAQRISSLAAYKAADTVRAVIAYDGEGDEACAARNGQEFSFDEAEAEAAEEHPNGTLGFGPVVASTPAELIPA